MNGTMLDETDHNIIQVLCEDARTSLRKISERIGVSLGAVSNRVKKLEERGIIKGYSVLLDHEKIGWELNVVIGLRIKKGRLIEIQEKIAKDNRIYGAYDVTGDFDSMILARAENRKDLDNSSTAIISGLINIDN